MNADPNEKKLEPTSPTEDSAGNLPNPELVSYVLYGMVRPWLIERKLLKGLQGNNAANMETLEDDENPT